MKSSDRSRGGRGPRRPERPDHRRITLAATAARIMHEEGIKDFRSAKEKAAERLGLGRNSPLPTNGEIESALAERNRIFHADSQPALLAELRQAALAMMHDLAPFEPRLVGDVLSGVASVHSTVDLHLFSDTSEAVATSLAALGIGHRHVDRRQRLRRDEVEPFPCYRFRAHGCEFTGTVFPLRLRGHAPLSPVDGRPMRRAGLKEVAELLGDAGSAQRFDTST